LNQKLDVYLMKLPPLCLSTVANLYYMLKYGSFLFQADVKRFITIQTIFPRQISKHILLQL